LALYGEATGRVGSLSIKITAGVLNINGENAAGCVSVDSKIL